MRKIACLVILMALAASAYAKGPKKDARIVTIAALIDMTDDVASERAAVNDALVTASMIFEKKFGIKFKLVSAGRWCPPANEFDAEEELEHLRDNFSSNHEADIVVAFTRKRLFREEEEIQDNPVPAKIKKELAGLAVLLGRTTIVQIHEKTSSTLVHELGHIFGAAHSRERNSVMMGAFFGDAIKFDSKNRAIILANRDRKF